MATEMNRRQFMGKSAAAAAGAAAFPRFVTGSVLGANERIGVGVIGCGGRGHAHLNTFKGIAREDKTVEIAAVCDVYRPRLDSSAKAYRAEAAYMDHRELLADPKVDMVSIATPTTSTATRSLTRSRRRNTSIARSR